MNHSYKSIAAPSKGLFKDKGSKFLAFAYPVECEEEIREKLDLLKKEYHDARHHCYAWRLGPDKDQYRINDDGEPSGSAGRPIFGQLQAGDLTQILVVVVRYFGGTLLGVGGLINAYRSATADALGQATIITRKVMRNVRVEFPYPAMNGIMKTVKEYGLELGTQHFDMDCSIELGIWLKQLDTVCRKLEKTEGCKIVYL